MDSSRSSESRSPCTCSGRSAGSTPAGSPSTGITRAMENAQGSPSKSARMVPEGPLSLLPFSSIAARSDTSSAGSGSGMPCGSLPSRQPKVGPPARGMNTIMSSVPISAAALPMLL